MLDIWRFGVATTVTFSLLYVACAAAVALFPEGAVEFFNNWFHGIDLAQIRPAGGRPITIGRFVAGLIGVVVVALPGGAVLAWTYNALRRGATA